jgi:hypothetical protein
MFNFGYLIESMVSILLLLTILYCVRLNKQLRILKADENALRATISELITATDIAERAIDGLKSTMRDSEQTLSVRLRGLENLSGDIERQLAAGEELLAKLIRITGAGNIETRAPAPEPGPERPDARSVAAAAQAFAERTKARLTSLAA